MTPPTIGKNGMGYSKTGKGKLEKSGDICLSIIEILHEA